MTIAVHVHDRRVRDPRFPIASALRAEPAQELAFETEIGRVHESPTIFTFVDEEVASHLHERTVPFALLLTPHETVEGLTQPLVERAAGVFRVGAIDTSCVLPASFEQAAHAFEPLTVTEAEVVPLDGEGEWWLYPTDALSIWERCVTRRHLPKWLGVVTDPDHPPPRWLERKLAEHGVDLKVAYVPPSRESLTRACDSTTTLLRDNSTLDAIDLVLAGKGCPSYESAGGASSAREAVVVGWGPLLLAATDVLRVGATTSESRETGAARGSTSVPETPTINIVCFNPTYLFKDLVERFERVGCVHSELPMASAQGYIWMRPQELAAFTDVVRGNATTDVPKSWLKRFEMHSEQYEGVDLSRVEAMSVAIHHGTCFDPIVQFDPYRLAKKLATAGTVAGVCERDLCYGPSAAWANPNNFEFVPIGYDHELFTESVIRRDTREGEPLKIGFVGRAYGTNRARSLAASNYAHPRGYRKGGDHLLHVLLRLKAMGIPFELQLVGNNWDDHVDQMKALGLPVRYYARDADIDYRDYPRVFASFDALLIAARAEGGPVSAIEAMSVGVPVIGSNVGIVPYCAQMSKPCRTVRYDTKWHTFDDRAAAEALAELHKKRFTSDDRLAVRRSIERHTTQHWVRSLRKIAVGLVTGSSVSRN